MRQLARAAGATPFMVLLAAFQALLLNPLSPNASGCRALLDDLLEVNKQHLQGTFF